MSLNKYLFQTKIKDPRTLVFHPLGRITDIFLLRIIGKNLNFGIALSTKSAVWDNKVNLNLCFLK